MNRRNSRGRGGVWRFKSPAKMVAGDTTGPTALDGKEDWEGVETV